MQRRLNFTLRTNWSWVAIFVFLILMIITLQKAGTVVPANVYTSGFQIETIRKISPMIFNTGDTVFLASQNDSIQPDLERLDLTVYNFKPKEFPVFETSLLQWLNHYCESSGSGFPPAYFVWIEEGDNTVIELANVARSLNFFFKFEAVAPFDGVNSIIIDKIFRLIPKTNLINRYCKALTIAGSNPALVIVNSEDYIPFIGVFQSGSITWLASSPARVGISRSDFEVSHMPGSLQHIMWAEQFTSSWNFENQDTIAYERAVKDIAPTHGLVLIDRDTPLGSIASQYFQECSSDQQKVEGSIFRKLCMSSSQ
jgi:hypothetical protein